MKKSTYYVMSSLSFAKSIAKMKAAYNTAKDNVENLHVVISLGNMKVGAIPSVSLLPVIDCGNCKSCSHSCYDLRHDLMYNSVKDSRAANSAILAADPERYFREIEAWITFNYPRAFRWHIGGDIKGAEYLAGMVKIAENHSDIQFLAFTKMFSVVNDFVSSGNKIPENLKILFSGWLGQEMDNPYNFPSTHPLFSDGSTSAHDGAKLCTGNCTECLKEERLCWSAKSGEEIIFNAH